MKIFLLVLLAITAFLSGCATPGTTGAHSPTIFLLGQSHDRKGFVLDQENRDFIVAEGVPITNFAPYVEPTYWEGAFEVPTPPDSFYIDRLKEITAARIVKAKENPQP